MVTLRSPTTRIVTSSMGLLQCRPLHLVPCLRGGLFGKERPAAAPGFSLGWLPRGVEATPAYSRLNISMACNHCDNPVCLKGCPTRAYTKFAEYGAVLQDPDICFGCGYCTWVCPYNAPQLDTKGGHVSKCNIVWIVSKWA